MKLSTISIALLITLVGCGGGGGGGGTAGSPTTPVSDESEPPAIPPPLSVFDCTSDGPVQGSDVDTLPGGIFYGTLFDCTTNTTEYVYAVVNEQGDFSIVSSAGSENAKQLTGALHTDGDVFHGSGNLYTGQNVSSRLWVDGYIAQRTSLDGRWGTESGSYGFFKVDSYTEEWAFEADGHVSAEDASGCAADGIQMGFAAIKWLEPTGFYGFADSSSWRTPV